MATPLRVNSAQENPANAFISPQSVSRKQLQKRVSTGAGFIIQTPSNHLPESAENELDLARQRRHSRNFTNVPLADKNNVSEPLPSSNWTKDELLQHYSQCIKLSQENKINHKNAFDLQLIEHMGEMIRQDGALNFRVAGGTIFAGAKIYASRVDAIHSQIYRVLGSLSSGDKDGKEADDDNNVNDLEKKTKKRKKNSKILETNESNLRLHTINCSSSEESRGRSQNNAIDAASCASLMMNHTTLNNNEFALKYDAESFMNIVDIVTTSDSQDPSQPPRSVATKQSTMDCCPTFDNFDFDMSTAELGFFNSSQSEDDVTDLPSNNPVDETMSNCIDNCPDDDNADPLPDNFDNVFDHHAAPVAAVKPAETHDNIVDVTNLVAMAPPAEYSYFKPNALALCDGPTHWRKLRSNRTTVSSLKDKEDGTEVDKPRPKKRKVEEKRNITKYGRIVKDKRLLPQKISKTKLESLRCNVQDQLLLEYADQVAESLTRAKYLQVVLKPLTPDQLRATNVSVSEPANVVNFNYVNDEFCPDTANDDYDNSGDLFPDNTEAFFPDFSQTISTESRTEQHQDYNALLDGDHLVDQPRKTEKIQIHFAKRAKHINVRKLKSAMWNLINDDDENSKTSPSNENQCESEVNSDKKPDSDSTSSGPQLFSKIYSTLTDKVSKNMSENLSAPLAFTCLLHLANEKQLKIEGMTSLSDIKVSQENVGQV